MLKTLGAVVAAAAIAAGVTLLSDTDVAASTATAIVKADATPTCGRAWPYVETGCSRDANLRVQPARLVRVIGVDRL